MIFSRPLWTGLSRLMRKQISATSHEKPRVAFFWGGREKRSAFKALPGTAVLVTFWALCFQALGAPPAEKLPVLEPIGAAPIQSRRCGRAGITGFSTFSHGLTEPQARWTLVIRPAAVEWINPRARVRAAGYNQTQPQALARRQPAAIRVHRGRQNRRLGPPPMRAPWLMMSPAYCPP